MLSEEKLQEVMASVPHDANLYQYARAIEAAVLAEQAKQAAVWIQSNNLAKVLSGEDFLCRISARQLQSDFRPLYPAPAPEGMATVPKKPTKGMVMVPRKPTQEMLKPICDWAYGELSLGEAYAAVIAAAEKEAGKC